MAPRIKIYSKFTYFGAVFETSATFWPASTGLDHELVVACGLTQIPKEGSGCRWGGGQSVSGSSHRLPSMHDQDLQNVAHV